MAVRTAERARERLVRGVARLEGDVENAELALEQAEGSAFEEDAPPQSAGGDRCSRAASASAR